MELPIFPLQSVLLPGMPLALRVFETRFLALLRDVLRTSPPAFGVVLIERGREVGGGDARFGVGTVARIGDVRQGGVLHVLARGADRFEVTEWLPDDPYPRARVRMLPELPWSDADAPLLQDAERAVRRGLARASEYDDIPWSPDVKLPGDGAELAWRLAGIAPLGPLDHLDLLRSPDSHTLLTRLIAHLDDLERTWGAG